MAEELEPGTWMIRFECHACSMTATAVMNWSSTRAWWDHMETHVGVTGYSYWHWKQLALIW